VTDEVDALVDLCSQYYVYTVAKAKMPNGMRTFVYGQQVCRREEERGRQEEREEKGEEMRKEEEKGISTASTTCTPLLRRRCQMG
jgi:hypothetical protein